MPPRRKRQGDASDHGDTTGIPQREEQGARIQIPETITLSLDTDEGNAQGNDVHPQWWSRFLILT